ncbi:MAG TPA: peptide deformylase [Patescibacteria group bacterium]|nr:peptide deformylase [Patescibacteria group bacterium]
MIRSILLHPDSHLHLSSASVSADELRSLAFQSFLDDLEETLKKADGVGLAAPQVGMRKRAIIVRTGDRLCAFINPKIISVSKRLAEGEEGCLSVPGAFGIVDRHVSVKIKALTRTGERILVKATNLEAVIFQHEIDHLNGVLFIDKIKRWTKPPK